MHLQINTAIAKWPVVTLAILAGGFDTQADQPASGHRPPGFRGPVAVVLLDDGKLLLSANRRSGSISVIDTETSRVADEMSIGKKLSGLVVMPGRDYLLATDEEAHEVILVHRQGAAITGHPP